MGPIENEGIYEEDWSKGELLDKLVFPGYWPPGLPRLVLRWLAEVYDPRTMPRLQLARNPDGNISLLGWKDEENPDGPGLVEAVRGFALTAEELRLTRAWPNVVWCPRCWKDGFVPYDAEDKQAGYDAGFTPPALSRMDNATYICSACGQDEAMRDYTQQPPIPPDAWPVGGPGFGLGIATRSHYGDRRGPYGTNEGDIWTGTGSDVQARLDAEGEGMQLIHEVIDGEEKLYVTADAEIIDRARKGDVLYWQEKRRQN